MSGFNKRSLLHFNILHSDLQKVLKLARSRFEFEIICSHRNSEEQEQAFKVGTSKAHFGQSPHNFFPPVAADCIPTPLDWKNKKSFDDMAFVILSAAKELDISVRSGADWDRDGKRWEAGENDGPHFELHPWREKVDEFVNQLKLPLMS